jgi:sterol desaturase/sphingolipid hydroxylase (fatty acid hydroxylase superfamily)
MSLADLLGPMVPATYLVLLGLEAWRPARRFPPVRGWRLVGAVCLVAIIGVNVALPQMVDPGWQARHRLFDLAGLGPILGAAVGLAVLTLVNYGWHRAQHAIDLLWRGFHQLHHSPVRVDLSGFVYTHPLEMLTIAGLTFLLTGFLLGLDPLAAALVGYLSALLAMLQHVNVRTPIWLGYIVQRPESHCLHHERDIHARNYSDLPVWDMLFGTFANPPAFAGEVGFAPEASKRLGAMLAGVDVNGAATLGRPA